MGEGVLMNLTQAPRGFPAPQNTVFICSAINPHPTKQMLLWERFVWLCASCPDPQAHALNLVPHLQEFEVDKKLAERRLKENAGSLSATLSSFI
eukprot:280945-Pelagomonas_calceolata.AAC.3